MGVEWLIVGVGAAALVALFAGWQATGPRRKTGAWDDAGPGYMYSGDAFSGDTTSTPDCGDTGGANDAGAGCDGGGGDGGGGGGSD
jgi:hypothetical protein